MADYTLSQLVTAAYNAGFRGLGLRNAVATSLAENSSYSLTAHNTGTPGNPEDSYGPWQVNRFAHPQYTAQQLTTLDGAAKAAFEISNGGKDFTPWTQFVNGAYNNFLGSIEPVAALIEKWLDTGGIGGISNVLPELPSVPVPDIPNPLSGLIDVLKVPLDLLLTILNWMIQERHWWQIGFVLAGLGMTAAGITIFFGPMNIAEKAALAA